jgi:hypothetical protein
MAATYNFTGENALCQGSTWSWGVALAYATTGKGYYYHARLSEVANITDGSQISCGRFG